MVGGERRAASVVRGEWRLVSSGWQVEVVVEYTLSKCEEVSRSDQQVASSKCNKCK